MSELNLKLVVSGSNDGAIAVLNQVVERSRTSGMALQQTDSIVTFDKARAGAELVFSLFSRLQMLVAGTACASFYSLW